MIIRSALILLITKIVPPNLDLVHVVGYVVPQQVLYVKLPVVEIVVRLLCLVFFLLDI